MSSTSFRLSSFIISINYALSQPQSTVKRDHTLSPLPRSQPKASNSSSFFQRNVLEIIIAHTFNYFQMESDNLSHPLVHNQYRPIPSSTTAPLPLHTMNTRLTLQNSVEPRGSVQHQSSDWRLEEHRASISTQKRAAVVVSPLRSKMTESHLELPWDYQQRRDEDLRQDKQVRHRCLDAFPPEEWNAVPTFACS